MRLGQQRRGRRSPQGEALQSRASHQTSWNSNKVRKTWRCGTTWRCLRARVLSKCSTLIVNAQKQAEKAAGAWDTAPSFVICYTFHRLFRYLEKGTGLELLALLSEEEGGGEDNLPPGQQGAPHPKRPETCVRYNRVFPNYCSITLITVVRSVFLGLPFHKLSVYWLNIPLC